MSEELIQYDLSKPLQTIKFAEVLTKFIKEKNLTTRIQNKDYVNVEGWQFALSQLGIVPVLVSLDNHSEDKVFKYRAEVNLIRLSDDKVIGKGIAICSNTEPTKKSFQEYAIASMAQTRAEGKAARMLLSWLMKAAGFETTPTEEMMDTPEADEIGDDGRQFLINLLERSTLDDKRKEDLALRIDSLVLNAEYQNAKEYLLQHQMKDEDRIANGFNVNASDVNKAVNKKMKMENA